MEAGSIVHSILYSLHKTSITDSNNAASDTAKGLLRYAQIAGNMFLGYFLHKFRLFF